LVVTFVLFQYVIRLGDRLKLLISFLFWFCMWDLIAGRQTGCEGWRAARGELGKPPSSSSSAANGTAFRMADDGSVQSSEPGRLCGGVVRASGEHLPHQTAVRVRLRACMTAALRQDCPL